MYCVFLFRNASGELPSAQELRALGFHVSRAADQRPERGGVAQTALARAAEAAAPYGRNKPEKKEE